MTAHSRGGFAPKKSLGQNFIRDAALLDQIAEASGITACDAAFEIGAGLGGLTAALARRARSVIAIEIDSDLEPALRNVCLQYNNIKLIIGDALRLNWNELLSDQIRCGIPIKFISNLPYYITTPLLMKAFRQSPPFAGVACMAQAEVAQKLIAKPGASEYGPLSIWAQAVGVPRVLLNVPADAFDPAPNVESAFVACSPMAQPTVAPGDYDAYGRLLNAAFQARRKTLRNNLRAAYNLSADTADGWLALAGINRDERAERISPEGFARLLTAYRANIYNHPQPYG
ncbi:MAG: 16S rRNA (adenine(1518)-N(6)/adenine(1519)-N(6))-dimethyltransferase RsmA [Oscillospiraceae bacterium]|nr:16S rRNA (adenine(1518)-N(6)/adenine(1519)-N(6))-dimethyltransferase RsmA [Oscillospiraceae bacterium]